MLLGYDCLEKLLIASWIFPHPVAWVELIQQRRQFYPVWIDFTFQSIGAVMGIAGAACCYFLLRLSETARRWFLVLLPVLYLDLCYGVTAASIRQYGEFRIVFFIFVLSILGVLFFTIFVFYRRPSVVAWFSLKQESPLQSRPL